MYYWQINDGRIWSTDDAAFVGEVPAGAELVPLYDSGQPGGVGYLRDTIRFYGYGLGELAGPEELAAAARVRRNTLLAESDWTQLPDSPIPGEGKAAWAAYRQALRDISDQPGFPAAINWPQPPA